MNTHGNLLICPVCNSDNINELEDIHKCANYNREYVIKDNIPLMYMQNDWKNSKYDVTEMVNSFYEKTPFPNYEDMEEINELLCKISK